MTIWKAGMMAVCVDARIVIQYCPMPLVEGGIYTVTRVVPDVCPVFGAGHGLFLAEVEASSISGFDSDRFRPLNDAEQDDALIAKIKACKPAKQPVL